MAIDIQRALDDPSVPGDEELTCFAAAALAGTEAAELTLRIVDEAEGRVLNRDYRDKDYATNVLSFPAGLPEDLDIPLLGDVVLCAPVIEREARSQGKPLPHHWAHLVIHGVLHLRGFDHTSGKDAERMEMEEIRLLATLNIPDPYA